MEIKNYEINGQIIGSRNKNGLYNLRVEAWEKDVKYNDLLGNTITNSEGNFNIRFDSTYFREYSPESEPDIFFKVYMGRRLLKSTESELIKNASENIQITITIDTPELQEEENDKTDRVSSLQAVKASRFVQQSDFNGVYRQYREKAGNSLGLLSDMVVNTIQSIDLQPIRVDGVGDEELVNENVNDVRAKLDSQKIQVNEVHEYNPKLNNESLRGFKFLPANLKQGQTVDLYVKNDKVAYYKVVEQDKVISRDTGKEMTTQKKEIDKLKKELEASKKREATKDKDIALLQKELKTLTKSQDSINKLLKSDKMTKLLRSME